MGQIKHHLVRARLANIAAVRDWVSGRSEDEYTPEFRKALLRKTMINLGVTRMKAREYIMLVLGDEE